jgi:hypothetical protein
LSVNDPVDLPVKGIESMKRLMELSSGWFRNVQKICVCRRLIHI